MALQTNSQDSSPHNIGAALLSLPGKAFLSAAKVFGEFKVLEVEGEFDRFVASNRYDKAANVVSHLMLTETRFAADENARAVTLSGRLVDAAVHANPTSARDQGRTAHAIEQTVAQVLNLSVRAKNEEWKEKAVALAVNVTFWAQTKAHLGHLAPVMADTIARNTQPGSRDHQYALSLRQSDTTQPGNSPLARAYDEAHRDHAALRAAPAGKDLTAG